jgi:hypothetical protein
VSTGLPKSPEQIEACGDVDLLCSGGASWGCTVYPTIPNGTAVPIEIFGVGASAKDRVRTSEMALPPRLFFDRIHLRMFVKKPLAAFPVLKLEVWTGYGCDADLAFAATVTPNKDGVVDLVQLSGWTADHYEIRACTAVEDDPAIDVSMDVEIDRAGGPYQLAWNPTAAPALVMAVTFPPGAVAAPWNVFPF